MNFKKNLTVLFLLIASGIGLFFTKGISGLVQSNIFSGTILVLSLFAVFFYTGGNKRLTVFLGGFGMIIATFLYVANNTQLYFGAELLLPTIFVAFGTGFLALYLDETRSRSFLYISIGLILPGIWFATFLKKTIIADWISIFSSMVVNTWPYLLIVIGIGSLIRARKTGNN